MTGAPPRTQSPELTGGAGFTYEAHVAARYLVALLTEGSAPGLSHRIVRRVALQHKSAGEPLDDVIVDANGIGDQSRLSLQVKRQITISSAATNADFREAVVNSWGTLQKSGFRENVARYGIATGTVCAVRLRELRQPQGQSALSDRRQGEKVQPDPCFARTEIAAELSGMC